MTADELLQDLAIKGGFVVSTDQLYPIQVAIAKANDDLYVSRGGFGFARVDHVDKMEASLQ